MNGKLEPAASRWRIPPLVARELLAYSRRPWTYWVRLLTALGAVSVLAIMAAMGRNRLDKTDGAFLFTGSTVIVFIIACLNGLRSTSDCVGVERRQGTLVLLFLANLNLDTILVSKLVTNSMRNAWALLGTLPVMGLCLLLGGVSGLGFAKGVLAILAASWLSLTVGLEQSCRNQGEHEAFSRGLRQLIVLNLIPLVSPASLVLSASATGSLFWSRYYWVALGATILAGFQFWLLAKSNLSSNWKERQKDEAADSGQLVAAAPPVRGHLNRPPRRCGDTPPAYWLFARYADARQATPQAIGILFAVTAASISMLVFLAGGADAAMWSYLPLMGLGRIVQILAMAKLAPQSFGDITRHGALEILQTTPVTLKEIVRAAYSYLVVHFRRGLLPMLGLDALVLLMVASMVRSSEVSAGRLALLLLAQNSLLLSSLCATGAAGIWLGLKQRSLARASFSVVFYFMVLPGFLYLLWPAGQGLFTLTLTIIYCASAMLIARRLSRLVQGGDSLHRLLRSGE